MRRPIVTALILAAGFVLAAGPAAAQHRGHNSGHRAASGYAPSAFDWRSQLDRPGDYRCDAFWDANRTDCDARWRDQRHRVSYQARRDYRALAGYGGNSGYHRGGYRPDQARYPAWRRGYGYNPGYHRYGQPAGTAYHGAYGRPDLVYPDGAGHGRDPGRVGWCRATYRSYDPGSGYYRAYSGRLIFCG